MGRAPPWDAPWKSPPAAWISQRSETRPVPRPRWSAVQTENPLRRPPLLAAQNAVSVVAPSQNSDSPARLVRPCIINIAAHARLDPSPTRLSRHRPSVASPPPRDQSPRPALLPHAESWAGPVTRLAARSANLLTLHPLRARPQPPYLQFARRAFRTALARSNLSPPDHPFPFPFLARRPAQLTAVCRID